MGFFLQIVGGLVLVVVLIVIGMYIYIRIKLGKFANMNMDDDMTPLIVHLNEDILPEWVDSKEAKSIEKELDDLGFTGDKAYNVVEMSGMQLKAFFNHPYTAVMYTHPIAGLWVDMVANVEDGTEYTATNAPMGGEIDPPPNAKKYWLKGVPVAQLFDRLKDAVGDQIVVPTTPENFREMFEESYKNEMRWKSKSGGISFEEFMRVVENDPRNYKDNEVQEAFLVMKEKELLRWHSAAVDEYVRSELEFTGDDDFMGSLFIVPIKTEPIALIRYFESISYLTDQQAEKFEKRYLNYPDVEIKELFNQINESFSPELRAVKRWDTDYPIDIELYEMPMG